MPGPGHGLRAALALASIVLAGTVGLVAVGARDAATGAPAAPGLRANLLPPDLDGAPAPRIVLRDARGARVDRRALAGRPYLVAFVYAGCVDVCPLIGAEIAQALDRLGPRAPGVAALAVSVDPRGDTPRDARRWLARLRLPRNVRYLLGARDELLPVWRDFYVVPGDGDIADPRSHDASVWLVDARGRLRGRWAGGEGIAPEDIAHDLRVLLDEAHAS